MSKLQEELEARKEYISQVEAKRDDLLVKFSNLEKSITQLEANNQTLVLQKEKLEKTIEAHAMELQLREQTLQKEINHIKVLMEKREKEIEKEMEHNKQRILKLEAELTEVKTENEQRVNSLTHQLHASTFRIRVQEEAITREKEDRNARKAEVEEVKRQLNESKLALEKMMNQSHLVMSFDIPDDHTKTINLLNLENNDLRKEKEKLSSNNVSLMNEVATLKVELSEFQSLVQGKEEEILSLLHLIQSQVNGNLQNTTMLKEIEKLRTTRDDLLSTKRRDRITITELEQRIEAITRKKEEHELVKQVNDTLRSDLQIMQSKMEETLKQLNEARAEVKS